jgi:hypothetical protein
MYNTKTKIKTILFASLIAAMILPFSTMDFAEAVKSNDSKINEFKQKALRDNEIPSSELLERVGDQWLSSYRDAQHFDEEENTVKRFVERNLQKNDLNKNNAILITKIQNFETITNTVGNGHEIVLLVAELEKANNSYNPSEPVSKYHAWAATQYTVPDTLEEVSDKLLEIVGDKKFTNLAKKQANNFNSLAELGSVPSDMMKSDPEYWNFIIMQNYCEEDPECDVTVLKQQPGATDEEINDVQRKVGNKTDVSFNLWDYILPEVFAAWHKVQVNYTMTAVINLESCRYFNCYESWYDGSNTGAEDIDHSSYDSPSEHVWSTKDMSFYGTVCDTYGGSETVISEVDTTPYLATILETSLAENDVDYNNCAVTSNTSTATHDWVVGILVESPGSYYWAP